MTVLTYIDPEFGSIASEVYTTASPELPVGTAWNVTADVAQQVESGWPWYGATLLDMNDNWYSGLWKTDLTSADVPATQGRLLVELEPPTDDEFGIALLNLRATTSTNFRLQVYEVDAATDFMRIQLMWNGGSSENQYDFSLWPANPFALEIVWDTNNATADQRLKARLWTIGGTPDSLAASTYTNGSAAATDQPTGLWISDPNNNAMRTRMRRLIISDDIAEDLSTWSPGGGIVIPRNIHHFRQQGIL